MESGRCCKKHQATDRLWSLVVMVYVLCRIMGDLGPPQLLNVESFDASGRQALVQAALAAFGRSTQDAVSVDILLQDGSPADLSLVGEGTALYFSFTSEPSRQAGA